MLFVVNLNAGGLGQLDEIVDIPDDHVDYYRDEIEAGFLQPVDGDGNRIVHVAAPDEQPTE